MAINIFGDCPDDCNTILQLPALDVDQNCTSYSLFESQLTDLWIKPNTALVTPFAGWGTGVISATDPTASPASIINAALDNSAVKWVVGEGGVPAPDKTVQELPKFKDRVSKRTYTMTYTVKNMSDAHYNFGAALQCGDTNFTFWYGTTNHVYGSETGIEPKSIDVDFPKGEGRDDVETMVITIVWEAKGDPQRRLNPYT